MRPQLISIHYCQCGCGELLPPPAFPSKRRRFLKDHRPRLDARPLPERFWEKTQPATDLSPNGMSGCLLWTGARRPAGYGNIWYVDSKIPATHAAWLVAGNERPLPGRDLDHLCRRPNCVNVDHLEDVTHTVNIQRGPRVTLTPELVRQIRERRANGETTVSLGRAFGVSPSCVTNACLRHTWKNVD